MISASIGGFIRSDLAWRGGILELVITHHILHFYKYTYITIELCYLYMIL